MYLHSFPRFLTLSIERFWFLFWSILNGVTLKTSNCFPSKFLDPLHLPVWRHIATGKSLGSLVQISKIWSNVCELWCCYVICWCKPFWYFVSVIAYFFLICFAGRVTGSPSISRDRHGHQDLNLFFSLKSARSSLENRRFHSQIMHVYISSILLLIKWA